MDLSKALGHWGLILPMIGILILSSTPATAQFRDSSWTALTQRLRQHHHRAEPRVPDSSLNAIHVGLLRQTWYPFTEVAATYERALWKRRSIGGTLGIGDLGNSAVGSPYWRHYHHLGVELRQYLAFRRQPTLSGFVLAIGLSFDQGGLIYRKSTQYYLRGRWFSGGPVIGYQLALLGRLRASATLRVAFYPSRGLDYFSPQGTALGRNTFPGSYFFYLNFRIGYTF
ncbi:MAG: hypothetical protein U0176_06035 [Bacteroidia bacterium]